MAASSGAPKAPTRANAVVRRRYIIRGGVCDDWLLPRHIVGSTRYPGVHIPTHADAGSTFGGDDSGYENDPAEEPRRTRQRPRRTYKQQNSVPRGQKRNRDRSDDGEGDSSDTSPRKSNRRKREKSSSAESSAGSDSILGDPQTRGRRIGEEWEANGIRYKVGPNGERLREAVVTMPRPLFPMVCLTFP